MCHIGAVLACNNNNNESELIHTIEMRREKSVSAQLTCEMKWVGVKWSEQEREFLCQNFALPHTENFLNDFFPLSSSIPLALTGFLLSRCLFLPYFNVPLLLFRGFCIPLLSLIVRRTPKIVYICTYLVVISLFNIVMGGREAEQAKAEVSRTLEHQYMYECFAMSRVKESQLYWCCFAAAAAISYRHKFFRDESVELFVEAEKYFYMWTECGVWESGEEETSERKKKWIFFFYFFFIWGNRLRRSTWMGERERVAAAARHTTLAVVGGERKRAAWTGVGGWGCEGGFVCA